MRMQRVQKSKRRTTDGHQQPSLSLESRLLELAAREGFGDAATSVTPLCPNQDPLSAAL